MRPSGILDYNAISRGAISACLCQNPPSHKAFPCLLESSEVSRDILEIPCERGVRSTLGTPAHGISKMFLLTQSLSLSSGVLLALFYILKYPSIERVCIYIYIYWCEPENIHSRREVDQSGVMQSVIEAATVFSKSYANALSVFMRVQCFRAPKCTSARFCSVFKRPNGS